MITKFEQRKFLKNVAHMYYFVDTISAEHLTSDTLTTKSSKVLNRKSMVANSRNQTRR